MKTPHSTTTAGDRQVSARRGDCGVGGEAVSLTATDYLKWKKFRKWPIAQKCD